MDDEQHPTEAATQRAPAQDAAAHRIVPASERISFRRRLLVTLGSALAVVFLVLGVLAWTVTYGWLNYQADTMLKREADEITSHIISPGGRLRINRYAWYEPHHRFSERRIDPYFVQVFNPQGALMHASANIRNFPPGAYPQTLLATKPTGILSFETLHTFRAGDALLYYDVFPIRYGQDTPLGYIQVARYEPDIAATLRRVTLLLLASLGLLLGGLLWLTRRIAGRVLQPLEAITRTTEDISPHQLHQRFSISDEADRETAQLAATLNTLLDRIEHSFEEMRRFTADAAHELQTPLTVLRGHVDVSLRRPRSVDAYQETLHLLGAEIDKLTRMVRGLLGLARLDRDPEGFDGTVVNLADLVLETATPFQEKARAAGLHFDVQVPEEACVYGKADLLREVLANVFDNAVKYTPEGTVTVRLETNDEQVVLTVTDTGIGIPPEALPHVTERFYRAAAVQSRNIPGSGLGLSLAARIMALHKGTLQIHSAPNDGTTIGLTFPKKDKNTAQPPSR